MPEDTGFEKAAVGRVNGDFLDGSALILGSHFGQFVLYCARKTVNNGNTDSNY